MFNKIFLTFLSCTILIGKVSTFGDLLLSTFMNHKIHIKPQFTPNDKWFTQRLDHFNPTDLRTWKQRYFVTEEYADGNRNVVFLMIGGEGVASDFWMSYGSWIVDAKKFKAILFQVEHRFYGMSRPLKDLSNESLVYLTSQQALGDLAFFIEAMNVKYSFSADTKWIVYGGSYAGNLAAWVRQKYPHLVHGAVSSSAPLLAKLDFPEYFRVVADSLRAADGNCPDNIKKAFDQVELLLQDVHGQNRIKELFNLCKDVDMSNEMNISLFVLRATDIIIGAVQNNDGTQTDKVCETMANKSMGSEVEILAAVNDSTFKPTCLDNKYEKFINLFRNISWDSYGARIYRQWTYQTCTEFGYYQTSTHQPQIFGNRVNLSFYIQGCKDIFGPEYNQAFLEQAVRRTNVLYGGLDIEVTNVVFVHGSLDPWHPLGITETRTNEAPAILIEEASHCADRFNPSDGDSSQLKAAREQIQELIGIWLNGTCKTNNKVSNIFLSRKQGILKDLKMS